MHIGCGSCEVYDLDEMYKPGIFKILDTIGEKNVLLLKQYIEKQDYYFHFVFDDLHYIMSNIPEIYGYILMEDLEMDTSENELNAAILWLKSLEKGVTLNAEKETLAWIDSWLEINKTR